MKKTDIREKYVLITCAILLLAVGLISACYLTSANATSYSDVLDISKLKGVWRIAVNVQTAPNYELISDIQMGKPHLDEVAANAVKEIFAGSDVTVYPWYHFDQEREKWDILSLSFVISPREVLNDGKKLRIASISVKLRRFVAHGETEEIEFPTVVSYPFIAAENADEFNANFAAGIKGLIAYLPGYIACQRWGRNSPACHAVNFAKPWGDW